ncbi:MAG: S8 family serine peptidase, partial [Promethearchaeota archaeon]
KNSTKKGDLNTKISHGTIIASILCNRLRDDKNNFIGIAPDIELIDFDVVAQKEEFFFSSILEIIDLIINEQVKLDIILISFSTKDPSDGTDILSLVCDTLVEKGIIVTCPAGNNGPELNTIGSPGAAKKVITFGALTKELAVSPYSGRGSTIDGRIKPDFHLPGSEIKIPISEELIVNATGTSIAAAIGTGLISLVKEFNPNVSYSEVLELFKNSSKDLNNEKSSQGNRLVKISEVFKSLNLLQEKTLPYNFLIKRSLKFSVEIVIILIVLFFIFYFSRVT